MDIEFILTYVPEAEYLPYNDALMLAERRDKRAAQDLLWSIQDAGIAI